MTGLERQLTELLDAPVEDAGYELVGLEFVRAGVHSTLRIYIDHENGINIDDCSAVSHQLSGMLDVEDPISGNYHLEVSSPGLDRPLFEEEHFDRFAGSEISFKLMYAQNGRKKFKGLLQGREGDVIVVNVDGEDQKFALSQIDKANLVPVF